MRSDAQLIDKSLIGQFGLFAQLVQEYKDRLFNTMVHVTGSCEEAEEVVQDAFLWAYNQQDSFGCENVCFERLYRAALKESIHRRQRHRPRASAQQDLTNRKNPSTDDARHPNESTVRTQSETEVFWALNRLSDEHRTVLVLREIEGCGYETIAKVLEWPVNKVRSRLHGARARLRELLRRDCPAALRSSDPGSCTMAKLGRATSRDSV